MSEQAPSAPTQVVKHNGILVMKGSRIAVPAGGFVVRINDKGEPETSITLHVSLDMTPHWLGLALDHHEKCQEAAVILDTVWQGGGEHEQTDALEAEFRAGMQACVCAAFALDAFYASVKDTAPLEKVLVDRWRDKRTAREAQIAETLRQRFKIHQSKFSLVRGILRDVFHYRNEAVHPKGKVRAPILHPRLRTGVEPCLAMYTAGNVKAIVAHTLSLITQLTAVPKPKFEQLVSYCSTAKEAIDPLVFVWEDRHGELYPRRKDHAVVR